MSIPMPNRTQIESTIRWLLTTGGPLAGWLNSQGVDQTQTSQLMTAALVIVPPLISWVWGLARGTDKQNVAAVAAMPDDKKASAIAKLPEEQQTKLASAIPDVAVAKAAGMLPGVEVAVTSEAAPSVMAAALDPSIPGVRAAQ